MPSTIKMFATIVLSLSLSLPMPLSLSFPLSLLLSFCWSHCLHLPVFSFADLPHVRRGRAEDPLHVRQQHQLQPEVQGVRLELQRRLPKLSRLVSSPSSFHKFC